MKAIGGAISSTYPASELIQSDVVVAENGITRRVVVVIKPPSAVSVGFGIIGQSRTGTSLLS